MPRLTKLSRSVAGRVAVVTGAASGMGRATAHLFADEGAHVAVVDITDAGVKQVVADIEESGGPGAAAGWVLDVTDGAAVEAAVAEMAGRFGGIDILVNNAGVSLPTPIDDSGYEDAWARTIAVNLTAQTRLIRACLPHLLRSSSGRIVNIASTEGLGATTFITPYTASKHGVIGLTRGLAVELGRHGITVNCICPGPIHTGMTAGIPEEAKAKYAARRVPLRRYGDPEEVAHATLSLVLPAASYINGAVLVVDGGMTIKKFLMDPFELLGVAPGASLAELRAARRRLAKELHPDLGAGRTSAAMAEVNVAFERALAAAPDPEPAPPTTAPAGRGPAGAPAPEPAVPRTDTEATFSVDVLPVEACEILIVVCRILGDVLAVEEPYGIEAYLEVPEPCFCALNLVPEAGGTIVTVEAEPADAGRWPGAARVRDAIVEELIALTTPARPASR